MKPDSQGVYRVSSCGFAEAHLDCPDCEASMVVDPFGDSESCPKCGATIWYDWDGDTDHGHYAVDVETEAHPVADEDRISPWAPATTPRGDT